MVDPSTYIPGTTVIRLAGRHWGRGTPCCLLIHGLGDAAVVWNELVAGLPADIAGTSIDLRGHGESPWDILGRYSPQAMAADVVSFMDAHNFTGLTLIGHSLGAEVAARTASARPERVARLVMVDGGPELELDARRAIGHELCALPRRFSAPEEFAELMRERHPLANPVSIHQYARAALRRTPHGEFELKFDPALQRAVEPTEKAELWSVLESVSCPVVLVRGALSSVLARPQAALVAGKLPNCNLLEVPAAGHSIALENPAALGYLLRPFLARTGGGPREGESSTYGVAG